MLIADNFACVNIGFLRTVAEELHTLGMRFARMHVVLTRMSIRRALKCILRALGSGFHTCEAGSQVVADQAKTASLGGAACSRSTVAFLAGTNTRSAFVPG